MSWHLTRDVKISTYLVLLLVSAAAFAQVDEDAARQLFDRLNQERSKAAVGELRWDDKLADVAVQHAQLMAERKRLSHQFPGEPAVRERFIAAGLRFSSSGENVALAPTVDTLHADWMLSAPHRANLLDPRYNAVGIGVVRRGDQLYAVQDFARRQDVMSDEEVETIIATQLTRARAQAGASTPTLVKSPEVHTAACRMASDGHIESAAIIRKMAAVHSVYTFTIFEPQKIPEGLIKTAPEAKSFAVGSCFGKTEDYPEGTNWVVVAFY